MYNIKILYNKIIKFLIPYTIIFIVEYNIYFFVYNDFSILNLIKNYICGGFGPGSYYTPLIIQLLILFPLIYFLYINLKNKNIFLLIGFIVNLLYEIIQSTIGLSETVYRLLIFRYIFLIFYGVYLNGNQNKKIFGQFLYVIIGAIILYMIDYLNYKMPFIVYWVDTSLLCSLYIIPITHILIKSNLHSRQIELLGRASYNIFLIQMMYYYTLGRIINNYINNLLIQILINVLLCVIGGLIFNDIVQKINLKIFRRKENEKK